MRDGADDATWDGSVKNLVYDTGSMTWVAMTQPGGGGGGGDASAANQLTEIGHLSQIEDALEGSFNPPTAVDAVTATYPDSVTEEYKFRSGGMSGTVLMTLTVIYASASKELISSVERT